LPGSQDPRRRALAAIAAATALNLPFGTLYAFSVFLKPMEQLLAIGRAQMAFVFALATIVLTVGMNVAPMLFRLVAPVPLILLSGAMGVAGLVLVATAGGFVQLALGYGVLFGLGGGIAFIVVQQGVNQAVTSHRGLINGYVVSLYPLGAMVGAPIFGWTIAAFGLRETIAGLAVAIGVAALVSAALFRQVGLALHDASPAGSAERDPQRSLFLKLFVVFLLAASAGLMVMSQAAGIVEAYGGRTALALGATTFITGAIAAARIGGGWLVDRFPMPHVAMAAHLWSLAGALLLTIWPGPAMSVPALAMVGMGYGIISGATAGAIAQYWHRNAFGRIASRMYIAWCLAAIVLPLLAGWLFDRTQGYGTAIVVAAGVNLLGVVVSASLPRR
jgi:MFS transporter, OFA family, oxalate/formate antiporter